MKRVIFFGLSILTIFLMVSCASSGQTGSNLQYEEIWTLGVQDKSYMEFALAPFWEAFPKAFPVDPVVRIGEVNVSEDFPYVFPGLGDQWAGGINHVFTIDFDLDEKYLADEEGSFELQIAAAGHWTSPMIWEFNLNGVTRRERIMPGGRSDEMLTDPARVTFRLYRIPFPGKALRLTDNRLAITSGDSWSVFDVIRFVKLDN